MPILIGSLTRLYANEEYPEINEELLTRLVIENKITEVDKIMIMNGVEIQNDYTKCPNFND